MLTVLSFEEDGLLDHDADVLAWIAENAPGAGIYFASMRGGPALAVFETEADAVLFRLVWSDRLIFV